MMPDERKYCGHLTKADGTHVPLSEEEAAALWDKIDKEKEQRKTDMPKTLDALSMICKAKNRLRDLGWRDAVYCPKDGSTFAIIQYGCTGIFPAVYSGEWPTGKLFCCDYFNHPDGSMFKPIDDLSDDERATMEDCIQRDRQMAERELAAFSALDEIETD